MSEKETALQQIKVIHDVINESLQVIIPAHRMIAVGLTIITIPGLEYLFSTYIDPILALPIYGTFIFRSLFYWGLFTSIGKLFPAQEKPAVLKKMFANMKFFPFIPLITAALLAHAGYADLINPIILIIIGLAFTFFGALAHPLVTACAWAFIIGGLAGIYATTLSIPHLWHYLLIYQGLICLFLGIGLKYIKTHSED